MSTVQYNISHGFTPLPCPPCRWDLDQYRTVQYNSSVCLLLPPLVAGGSWTSTASTQGRLWKPWPCASGI